MSEFRFDSDHLSQDAKLVVESCDINGDGHVAFVDFQELFGEDELIWYENEPDRVRKFRSKVWCCVSSSALPAKLQRKSADELIWLQHGYQSSETSVMLCASEIIIDLDHHESKK